MRHPGIWGLVLAVAGGIAVLAVSAVPRSDITTRSEEARSYYEEGLRSWLSMRHTEGAALFQKAVEADPEFAMAWFRLGNSALLAGDADRARAFCLKAERSGKRGSAMERLKIEGLRTRLDGDLADLREVYERTHRRFPEDTETLFSLQRVANIEGKYDEAIEHLKEIVRINQGSVLAYNQLGYLLSQRERWEEALDALRRYAFINSDEANPHDSLGELYERTGRYADALVEYERALDVDSSFVWAKFHRARVLARLGRYAVADSLLATDLDAPPEHPAAQFIVGLQIDLLLEQGCAQRAAALLETIEPRVLDPLARWMMCAEARAAEGDSVRTAALLDSAWLQRERWTLDSREDTTAFEYRCLRALVCESRREWDRAARWWQHSNDGRNLYMEGVDWTRFHRAECLLRAGKPALAEQEMASILKRNPVFVRALWIRALALEAEGRTAEARAVFQRIEELWGGADRDARYVNEARRRTSLAGNAAS